MKGTWKTIQTILLFPFVLVLAWFMSHLMALLGIFVAATYPVWVLFFPKNSICLGCRNASEGETCSLCNEKVEKNNAYPKNARSIALNTLIIIVLTILSIGVVYLENMIIDSSGILRSFKTVSFNIPDKAQYRTNEIFPMKIEILDIRTPINVVQADITFDPELLEVIDISTKSSFASIFVQKDINNNLGYVRLTGGIPSPGYSQSTGVFGTVYFKAKSAGLATVSFLPTSLVLADDGRGTNVLKDFPTSSYVIRPELIPKEEEVSQLEIYKKDVLGTTTENTDNTDDLNYCRIDLTPNGSNVLGATDDTISKDIVDTVTQSEPAKTAFFTVLIHAIDTFDSYVVGIFHKIVGAIFTN